MKIKELMTKNPVFIRPDDSIVEAAKKMEKIDCGILPVGNDADHCVGMITDRDIVLRALAKNKEAKSTKVKDVMTKAVYACHEDDLLEHAAELMREHKVNRLLVKNKKEKITGIVTFGCMLWKTPSATEVGHILDHASPRKIACA
mgnify:CR=1 FL=1